MALKFRLLDLINPKQADQCLKLIFDVELGDRRPSQLMETMLFLLPPGEDGGILFKTLYATKLPSKVRSQVMAGGISLSSREMVLLSDDLWFALNQCHYGAKSHPVAAAVPEDTEELEEAVAAHNVHPKQTNPRRRRSNLASLLGSSATARRSLGTRQRKCADPCTCMWSGNK